MRPLVDKAQKVPKIGPRLLNPHSAIGIRALHLALRIATRPSIRNAASKLFKRQSDEPALPQY